MRENAAEENEAGHFRIAADGAAHCYKPTPFYCFAVGSFRQKSESFLLAVRKGANGGQLAPQVRRVLLGSIDAAHASPLLSLPDTLYNQAEASSGKPFERSG